MNRWRYRNGLGPLYYRFWERHIHGWMVLVSIALPAQHDRLLVISFSHSGFFVYRTIEAITPLQLSKVDFL